MGIKDLKRFNKLVDTCVSILEGIGFVVLRQNNKPPPKIDPVTRKVIGVRDMPSGTKRGAPEIMMFNPPKCHATAFKIKLPGNELSDDDIEFMNELLKIGCKYHIISCADDLIKVLVDGHL